MTLTIHPHFPSTGMAHHRRDSVVRLTRVAIFHTGKDG